MLTENNFNCCSHRNRNNRKSNKNVVTDNYHIDIKSRFTWLAIRLKSGKFIEPLQLPRNEKERKMRGKKVLVQLTKQQQRDCRCFLVGWMSILSTQNTTNLNIDISKVGALNETMRRQKNQSKPKQTKQTWIVKQNKQSETRTDLSGVGLFYSRLGQACEWPHRTR